MGNINLSHLCGPNYENNEEIVTPNKVEQDDSNIESSHSIAAVRAFKPRYNESEWERLRTTIVARNYFRQRKLEPLLSLIGSN
jgi:hypothetical protein